jgi:AMMECR1 domain-containing protein
MLWAMSCSILGCTSGSIARAMLLAGSLLAAGPGVPAPELEPYREMARDASAREVLLDVAREGLAATVGEASAPAPASASASASAPTPAPARAAAPDWPGSPRPLYVTLARAHSTRACVGADVPPGGALAASLRLLGGQLATNDRRHPPVRAEELDALRLVIAFAGDPSPVADPMSIDPMREGLKIETDRGAVAFLPGEARTVAWAIREARRIGVLSGPLSEARCSRFEVVTLQGPATRRVSSRKEPTP